MRFPLLRSVKFTNEIRPYLLDNFSRKSYYTKNYISLSYFIFVWKTIFTGNQSGSHFGVDLIYLQNLEYLVLLFKLCITWHFYFSSMCYLPCIVYASSNQTNSHYRHGKVIKKSIPNLRNFSC